MKIQLIIPMSGIGKRFIDAGYKTPKPLLKVGSKKIINHVVNMFEDIEKVIFICNEEHLNDTNLNLKETLKSLHTKTSIISIEPHKKGPIFAVTKAESILDPLLPTIVNYCDFNSLFSFSRFINNLETSNPDGCVFTYTGFHPHMLKNTNYAYVKKNKSLVIDIQEKQPFTENPMKEEVSSGTYYFRSAELMMKYFKKTMELELQVKGEYYVSMAYKPMIRDQLLIKTFIIDYFMQWGTPSDLEEFNWYSNIFDILSNKETHKKRIYEGCLLMPMAGKGSRFKKKGYPTPKPFIKVSGKAMYLQAIRDLPRMESVKIITRKELISNSNKLSDFKDDEIDLSCKFLSGHTNGQAITALQGANENDIKLKKPLIISACDMGMIFDEKKYQDLISSNEIDVIVWGCKGYPGALKNPNIYSWIYQDKKNIISKISVKNNLKNPKKDYLLIGTFTFKKAENFIYATNLSIANKEKINGEYYIDNVINKCIEIGLKVVLFEVDYFICWGTPDELNTYNYWETCFDKWIDHPFKKKRLIS